MKKDASVSAPVILHRIQTLGYEGQITILREYLRKKRGQIKYKEAFFRFESRPGQQMQIDWGHFGAISYKGINRKLYALVVIEKCNELRLTGFSTHIDETLSYAQDKNWSYKKVLLHLMNLEIERRKQSRIDLRFRQSRLNEQITIDQFEIEYHKSRKDQKNTILNLTHPEFINQKKEVVLIGHPRVGKTYLARCICYTATQSGIKVLFTTAMDMINQLIAAEADHSLVKKLAYYQSPALLIIDEIGYLPLGSHGSNLFFQVISSRHQVKSTLITTNLPFSNWGW